MLRWEPKLGFLDAFLSLISDASTTPRRRPSAYPYPPHISNTLPLDFHPVPLPVMPAILDITCADVTIAQMIMQLVHDYRSQFPFLTVSMALRAWLKTNNHLAIGVVCMARFLADSETIDLSAMNLDSVPEALQTLTSSALNLSRNFIKKLPKWLAKAPNVRFGHWYGGSGINHIYIRTNIHKLVFVGDTGVGKTTLLRCLMEGKKKLKAKHAHTGIAVYRNVTLKGAENSSYTIWDLGGDSLSPFHQWFLLSRSVFIVTFDVSKALMMEEPHMAVYKWLNEISVARSKGSKTGRCIIPVGTHMDQVDPHDPKLAELLTRVFMLEDVVFLVDLNKGKGWRCDKCQMEGLGSVVTDVCKEITGFSSNDDGVPKEGQRENHLTDLEGVCGDGKELWYSTKANKATGD
ncbi:hypothetical protein Pelo_18956 [Pelomyxa schiedti]|nr:hypothetical protein Pelo_18956 [Pelomyxa schiedti]